MTHPEVAAPADADALDDWLDRIDAVLARLQDVHLPADFPFDYSRASLDWLESLLLERFQPGAPVAGDGLIESTMAYLGESLLGVAGGVWAVGRHPAHPGHDVPLVCPDQALGLPAVSPLHVIIEAVRCRDGQAFVSAHAGLERAVAGHRAEHPGWAPTRPSTFAVDLGGRTESLEYLRHWLAERERSWPRWSRDLPGGHWDFSPGSLDALQALVAGQVPAGTDLATLEHQPLVDGAVWYLGEVVRRATGARWEYHHGDQALDQRCGRPLLEWPDPAAGDLVPLLALRAAVASADPHYLRAWLIDATPIDAASIDAASIDAASIEGQAAGR